MLEVHSGVEVGVAWRWEWPGGGSGLDGLEVEMTLQCSWDSTATHIKENLQSLAMV